MFEEITVRVAWMLVIFFSGFLALIVVGGWVLMPRCEITLDRAKVTQRSRGLSPQQSYTIFHAIHEVLEEENKQKEKIGPAVAR